MIARRFALAAFVSTTLWTGVSVAAEPQTQCASDRGDAVAETMRDMYAALSADDEARLKTIVTADFYSFDAGKRFDGPALAALVRNAHKAGKTFVWTVNEPDVRMQCDWAWITYTNRGSVTDASATTPVTWLESAVLRFETGRWRIAFFHSSRAAPAS
ncbi:MAG: nuclear transport factor 2 family protein [Alphaproteobacteria bacterium]|nr:nuclear transport factor 2 family protein [Alphaproteobacteria bacterium]